MESDAYYDALKAAAFQKLNETCIGFQIASVRSREDFERFWSRYQRDVEAVVTEKAKLLADKKVEALVEEILEKYRNQCRDGIKNSITDNIRVFCKKHGTSIWALEQAVDIGNGIIARCSTSSPKETTHRARKSDCKSPRIRLDSVL